jgi:hypothetical protein
VGVATTVDPVARVAVGVAPVCCVATVGVAVGALLPQAIASDSDKALKHPMRKLRSNRVVMYVTSWQMV